MHQVRSLIIYYVVVKCHQFHAYWQSSWNIFCGHSVDSRLKQLKFDRELRWEQTFLIYVKFLVHRKWKNSRSNYMVIYIVEILQKCCDCTKRNTVDECIIVIFMNFSLEYAYARFHRTIYPVHGRVTLCKYKLAKVVRILRHGSVQNSQYCIRSESRRETNFLPSTFPRWWETLSKNMIQ